MFGTREHDIAMMYGYNSPEFGEYMKEHDNPELSNFIDEIGQGIQNAWYDLTGQTEKTSYYQAQVEREDQLIKEQQEREDSAYQRQVEDMKRAGLSMYGASGGGAASSAGGSSSVHSGSDSISKIAAMIDMKKAMAEIGNVQANTNKTNAEAAATTAGVERDDKYYALAEKKQGAELVKMEFDNILTQQMTAESAQKVIASVQTQAREDAKFVYDALLSNADLQLKNKDIESYDERKDVDLALKRTSNLLNVADLQLKNKDIESYDERKEAEMAVKRTSAALNYERSVSESKQREYYDQLMRESEEKIRKYLKEELHLDAETLQLGVDYALAELKLEISQYDYDYSVEHGIRTSDAPSKVYGINLDQFAQNLTGFHVPNFDFSFNHSPKNGGGYAW